MDPVSRKQFNVTAHRLGVAKEALKKIADYQQGMWEDDGNAFYTLKFLAEAALSEINSIGKEN